MNADASPIRILAVDDHPLLRQGIAGLVTDQPDMTLVAEASNERDAIQQFRAHPPDVTHKERLDTHPGRPRRAQSDFG